MFFDSLINTELGEKRPVGRIIFFPVETNSHLWKRLYKQGHWIGKGSLFGCFLLWDFGIQLSILLKDNSLTSERCFRCASSHLGLKGFQKVPWVLATFQSNTLHNLSYSQGVRSRFLYCRRGILLKIWHLCRGPLFGTLPMKCAYTTPPLVYVLDC